MSSFEAPPTAESPIHPETETNPISQYVQTLWSLLSKPTHFFRGLPLRPGIVWPLLFAVLTHWLGSGLSYLWKVCLGQMIEGRLADFFVAAHKLADIEDELPADTLKQLKDHFLTWVWGVGSVIVDPFFTVAKVLLTSIFIWVAARIFGDLRRSDANERYAFESAVAVSSFAMAPAVLNGIPIVGGIVASLFTFIITFIGVREIYRVSSGRSLLIVLFPTILAVTFFLALFLIVAVFLLKFFMLNF